jgi:RNA polymerase sigma factor (sigma-70 family)
MFQTYSDYELIKNYNESNNIEYANALLRRYEGAIVNMATRIHRTTFIGNSVYDHSDIINEIVIRFYDMMEYLDHEKIKNKKSYMIFKHLELYASKVRNKIIEECKNGNKLLSTQPYGAHLDSDYPEIESLFTHNEDHSFRIYYKDITQKIRRKFTGDALKVFDLYLKGETVHGIANTLGCSSPNVSYHLRRIKRELKYAFSIH